MQARGRRGQPSARRGKTAVILVSGTGRRRRGGRPEPSVRPNRYLATATRAALPGEGRSSRLLGRARDRHGRSHLRGPLLTLRGKGRSPSPLSSRADVRPPSTPSARCPGANGPGLRVRASPAGPDTPGSSVRILTGYFIVTLDDAVSSLASPHASATRVARRQGHDVWFAKRRRAVADATGDSERRAPTRSATAWLRPPAGGFGELRGAAAEKIGALWAKSAPSRQTRRCGFAGFSCIGETGFEPATARPPAGCATRLRHSPWCGDDSQRGAGRCAAMTDGDGLDGRRVR